MGIFNKGEPGDAESLKKAKQEKKEAAKELLKEEFGKAKKAVNAQIGAFKESLSDEYEGIKPDQLYETALKVGAKSKFSIVHTDKASRSITFQTHQGEKHWDGVISCFVTEGKKGAVLDVVGRAPQGVSQSGLVTLNPFKASIAAAEIGIIEGIKGKFKISMRKELNREVAEVPTTPEVEVKSTPSVESLSSQILQLKELHDAGVLSAAEFEKAKAKLLG
jgi:hypothetical protein